MAVFIDGASARASPRLRRAGEESTRSVTGAVRAQSKTKIRDKQRYRERRRSARSAAAKEALVQPSMERSLKSVALKTRKVAQLVPVHVDLAGKHDARRRRMCTDAISKRQGKVASRDAKDSPEFQSPAAALSAKGCRRAMKIAARSRRRTPWHSVSDMSNGMDSKLLSSFEVAFIDSHTS